MRGIFLKNHIKNGVIGCVTLYILKEYCIQEIPKLFIFFGRASSTVFRRLALLSEFWKRFQLSWLNIVIQFCLKNLHYFCAYKMVLHITIHLKAYDAYLIKKNTLWMKTIHYPTKTRSHLVTIVPMVPFTSKSTSKLRSALHFRYSTVIPRFIPRANTAQS